MERDPKSVSAEELATRLQLDHPEWTVEEVELAVRDVTGVTLAPAERPSIDRG